MAKDGNFSESIIPSLRSKESLRASGKIKHRKNEDWIRVGGIKAEAEYVLFYKDLWSHCTKKIIQNRGHLKIVTFGSGKLNAVLDLKERLAAFCAEQKLTPNIEIVDYSLTKRPALDSLAMLGQPDLRQQVRANKAPGLRVHIGPLEVKDIRDARGADVMMSVYGPFHHAKNAEDCIDMIKKTAKELADGGSGFFQIYETMDDDVDNYLKHELTPDTGGRCQGKLMKIIEKYPDPRVADSKHSYLHITCDPPKI